MQLLEPHWHSPRVWPALDGEGVHLWLATLDQAGTGSQQQPHLLSPDELERASRFRSPVDRQRYITGRSLLRRCLARYLNLGPAEIHFSYSPHGKPALADVPTASGASLCFNVSHSAGLVLLAFAWQRSLGVDIEQVRLEIATERMAARFFTPREQAWLQTLPAGSRPVGFFVCWTCKEACAKADGRGLSLATHGLDVSAAVDGSQRPPAVIRHTEVGAVWTLQPFAPTPGCAGALAVEGLVPHLTLSCWNATPLLSP